MMISRRDVGADARAWIYKTSNLIKYLLLCAVFISGIDTMTGLCGHAPVIAAPANSFFNIIGDTDGWRIALKDYSVSTPFNEAIFELRVGEIRHFSFNAHRNHHSGPGRTPAAYFGPLQKRYSAVLSGLLGYALQFAETAPKGDFSLRVDLTLYPETIGKWAKKWQKAGLREKWKTMDPYKRYPLLTKMIADVVKTDMAPIAGAMGFTVTGADMEKMTYPKAGGLDCYPDVLAPAGIDPDMVIPIPLMLRALLEPARKSPDRKSSLPDPGSVYSVDYIFTFATRNGNTIYCSYNRDLDIYEISGDKRNEDESYSRLLPLTHSGANQTMAVHLLSACLTITGARQGDNTISLRLTPGLYPDLYGKMTGYFTLNPDKALKSRVYRPELPAKTFYKFFPGPSSPFKTAVTPFFNKIGYELKWIAVNLSDNREASGYPDYETVMKPLGINPGDKPSVPDIVYLIAGKQSY